MGPDVTGPEVLAAGAGGVGGGGHLDLIPQLNVQFQLTHSNAAAGIDAASNPAHIVLLPHIDLTHGEGSSLSLGLELPVRHEHKTTHFVSAQRVLGHVRLLVHSQDALRWAPDNIWPQHVELLQQLATAGAETHLHRFAEDLTENLARNVFELESVCALVHVCVCDAHASFIKLSNKGTA